MKSFSVSTPQRTAFVDITAQVQESIADRPDLGGAVVVFVPHTTAGITINENADPSVLADLEAILEKFAPWRGAYRHAEGNAAAHAKASLVGSSVTIPIEAGQLQLGTWQGVYLCEFDGPRTRLVWVQPMSA